eukprot:CAMPEP_0170555642 /NCGR_PEP_ID=MMETSP0211-20121228/13518_1 /TAXON_ID=311385 /ORGANISM="Pseudokeronopsis sp., Strain OXSARD2" /LENGTH=58 /DNA_ID=CAMNT_0010865595 /DNA_START=486 /DNA_END=662 /DNA_ORIENTATION=-
MANSHSPGFVMYSGTKIFLDYFTQALAFETKTAQGNLDVLLYKPGFVETKLSGKKEGF